MKAVKFTLKLLLWIIGVVLVLVLALPLWIGPVVKTAANAVVPKKTGTSFNLGAFGLNPYSGKLSVGDMQLWNPQDFEQKMAVTLGALNVVVDATSLAGDVIVIKDIDVKDVFVSYVSNAKGENNFAIIKKNATGGKVEPVAQGEGKGKSDAKAVEQPAQQQAAAKDEEKKPAKKVIIDHLLISNVRIQLGPLMLPMPNIELRNIGRKTNGATVKDAWNQVYAQITASIQSLGVNLGNLIKGIDKTKVDKVLKVFDAVKKIDTQSVKDSLNSSTDAATDAASKTVDKTVEKATETIKALKSLF